MTSEEQILNLSKRIKALSDTGLLYCKNEYDIDRYKELQSISTELMSAITGQPISIIENFYQPVDDYPTPKVDVRALVVNDQKEILMIQESADSRWALPGGWAEIGLSPKEVVVKECREESGLIVEPKSLLAVFDKKCHEHPPQPHYVYKLIFHCQALTAEFHKGFDVLDVAWFDIGHLPQLSADRITKKQIESVYHKLMNNDFKTIVD